jgi:hypothetical protein
VAIPTATPPPTATASVTANVAVGGGRPPDLELAAQTGLTVDEVRSARADLVERLGAGSYFRFTRKGMPSRGWYDVDADRINSSTAQGNCAETNPIPPDPSNGHFGPGAEHDRATARTCVGHSPNMIGPPAESSIYKTLLEDKTLEEEPPLSPIEPEPKPEPRPEPVVVPKAAEPEPAPKPRLRGRDSIFIPTAPK